MFASGSAYLTFRFHESWRMTHQRVVEKMCLSAVAELELIFLRVWSDVKDIDVQPQQILK